MKVLTLHQPWASIVALGVKTIETRSWSTQYRGPLAIHAALRKPDSGTLGPYSFDASVLWPSSPYVPSRPETNTKIDRVVRFPLGAIVATCTLVDVVPITNLGEETAVRRVEVGTMGGQPNLMLCSADPGPEVITDFDRLLGFNLAPGDADPEAGVDFDPSDYYERDVTDELPYGLFTPGRYAWLLADSVPVDPPVPFRGGQGLSRTWEPEAA